MFPVLGLLLVFFVWRWILETKEIELEQVDILFGVFEL